MYQPQPAGGQPPLPTEPPQPVLTTVKLMYVGAALEVVELLLNLGFLGSVHANPATAIVAPLIGVALWVWMATMIKQGKNWARITGTVFFGIACLGLIINLLALVALMALAAGVASLFLILSLVVAIVGWVVGLACVILLWRKESTAYFTAMSAPRI